jgi:hypothetical protein
MMRNLLRRVCKLMSDRHSTLEIFALVLFTIVLCFFAVVSSGPQ